MTARASYLGLYASGELGRCYSGALPVVSCYTLHFGEEPALSGTKGAGNIFFGNCNRRNKSLRYNIYRAAVKALTAFDGCEVKNYEHPMLCFIYGSSIIENSITAKSDPA